MITSYVYVKRIKVYQGEVSMIYLFTIREETETENCEQTVILFVVAISLFATNIFHKITIAVQSDMRLYLEF